MGIESVGSRGPICSNPEDEVAPPPAATAKAAPSGPPPVKDEVVDAGHDSVISTAGKWLEQHVDSEVKGPKHAAESAHYADPDGKKDVFGKSNGGGTSHELKLWDTGPRAIKELSTWGDENLGGSLEAGWGRSTGKAFYESKPGERGAGVEFGAEVAALHGEDRWSTHLGDARNGVDVNTSVAANLLHVAATAKGGVSFGKDGAELKGKFDARAMLADVTATGSATFRIGRHNIGELGLKASAGFGAGVVADLHGKIKDRTIDWSSEVGAAWGLSGSIGTSGKVNVLALAEGIEDGGIPATALSVVATGEQVEAAMLEAGAAASRTEQAKLAQEGHGFAAAALGLLAKGLSSKAQGEREVGTLLQSGSDALSGDGEHE